MQSGELRIVDRIPQTESPELLPEALVTESGEGFVRLTDCDALRVDMQYAKQGIPGAVSTCYVRETVRRRLLLAQRYLPDGLRLHIYDAWRPFAVQQALFADIRAKFCAAHPSLAGEALRQELIRFVSEPRRDRCGYPVHCSGGSVDLTLETRDGQLLDMGTEFDCFAHSAYTAAFEDSGNAPVRRNRRLLYSAMTAAGFTNLPSEWWHYDFGTRFWGYYRHCACLYEAVYDAEEVENRLIKPEN